MTTIIKITCFEPLKLELPTTPTITGAIHLALPQLHVKVLDLSMGGIFSDDPHAWAEIEGPRLSFELGDNEMKLGDFVQFIQGMLPHLENGWASAQAEYNRRPLLGIARGYKKE